MAQNGDKAEAETEGLQWAKDYAPSPIMREIAAVALARPKPETLGSLKRLLNLKHTSTVSDHFQAQTPRRKTVRAYAHALGVSDEHLHIVETGSLSPARTAAWEAELRTHISAAEPYIALHTGDSLLHLFDSASATVRDKTLTAYALTTLRIRAGLPHESDAEPVLTALLPVAKALGFDGRKLRRVKSHSERYLHSLWLRLASEESGGQWGLLSYEHAREILNVVRAYLKAEGVDTRAMDHYLSQQLEKLEIPR
jgi:hypothetical protein